MACRESFWAYPRTVEFLASGRVIARCHRAVYDNDLDLRADVLRSLGAAA